MATMDPDDRAAWGAELRDHARNIETIASAIGSTDDNLAMASQTIGELTRKSTSSLGPEAANHVQYAWNWVHGLDSTGAAKALTTAAEHLRQAARKLSTKD